MNHIHLKKISLKATILALFLIIATIISFVFGWQLFYTNKHLSKDSINSHIGSIVQNIDNTLKNNEALHFGIINILGGINQNKKEHWDENFSTYIEILKARSSIYAIYTGYEDNSFYEIINLDIDANLRASYHADLQDKWLLIKIDGQNIAQRELSFFDSQLRLTAKKLEPNSYESSQRTWYQMALSGENAIKTLPYKFSHIDTSGITFSKRLENSKNVVSIDVLIEDFRNSLKNLIDTDSLELFLFKQDGTLISSVAENEALFKQFYDKENIDKFLEAQILPIHGKNYIVQIAPLQNGANEEYLALFGDYDKIIAPYNQTTFRLLAIFALTYLLMLPIILYFSRIIVKPIFELVGESNKIKERKYNTISKVESNIIEVSVLSDAFLDMSQSIYEYQNSLEEKVEERTQELKLKNEELYKISVTDKLTGIYNRVKLDKSLQENMKLSLSQGSRFAVIIMDIDFFKKINDNFGHQVGDDVLQECAQILTHTVSDKGIIGRWGGEEFLVICPETDLTNAQQLALQINQAIKAHPFSTYPHRVTMSVGVSGYQAGIEKYDEIVSNADKALYKAKENGRDRVEVN
ncbi:MAG: diguanylate cyclase [Comamonas sp.]|nr:diguanylate cyclase [Comamonas sp.]